MKREIIGQKLEELCVGDVDRAMLRMFVNSSGTAWLGDYLRSHAGRFAHSPRLYTVIKGKNDLVPGTLHRGGDVLLYVDAGVAVFASPLTPAGERVTRFADEPLAMTHACARCAVTWRLWRAAGVTPDDVEKAVLRVGQGGHVCEHPETDLNRGAALKLTNSLWLMGQSILETT